MRSSQLGEHFRAAASSVSAYSSGSQRNEEYKRRKEHRHNSGSGRSSHRHRPPQHSSRYYTEVVYGREPDEGALDRAAAAAIQRDKERARREEEFPTSGAGYSTSRVRFEYGPEPGMPMVEYHTAPSAGHYVSIQTRARYRKLAETDLSLADLLSCPRP